VHMQVNERRSGATHGRAIVLRRSDGVRCPERPCSMRLRRTRAGPRGGARSRAGRPCR
jgi:hypothetical protein